MRCVMTSFGSAGDFLPALAVGAALRRRGHEVTFVANPFYDSRVRHAGLELTPAGEYYDLYDRLEKNPAYGDPTQARLLFDDLIAPNTVAIHRVIGELLRTKPIDVVIASNVSFGAFWAGAEHGVPSVLVHPTPLMWMSWRAPAVLGDRLLPPLLSRPLTVAARAMMVWYLGRLMRPLARSIGTPLADVSFAATERMAALQLGLWSPRLRGPVLGDPPNGTICGFTRSSALGGSQPGLSAEVDGFLRHGEPPIVVGLGSAYALGAGPLLTAVAHACAAGGRRCLVVGHPSGMTFPANTLAVPYAPYDQVFPRAAAVVVHGGAGTTGEALRCGRPIIGVPFAADQFTLCAAIEQLGMGVRMRRGRAQRDFGEAIRRVLSDEGMRRTARERSRDFAEEPDGAESGADSIERLIGARAGRR